MHSNSVPGGIYGKDKSLYIEASEIVEDRCRNSLTMDIEAFNAIPRFAYEGTINCVNLI